MMKKFSVLLVFVLITSLSVAQKKNITLDNIWGGTFRAERMDVLHSMGNGQQYSVLNLDRRTGLTTIDIYDYKTLTKQKTLVSSKDLIGIQNFSDYSFSNDESLILLASNKEKIYRRSKLADYVVYNVNTKALTKVANTKIQEPTFSPDGTKVAYGFKNNIYVKDLSSGATIQVTQDGEKNKIINGITDWVYEEEFSFVRAFDWNANGDQIAFIRFDETKVPEFSMDVYGQELYQTQNVFKYPKAGETNAQVSLHIYNLKNKTTKEVTPSKAYNDFYIPRLKWTNDENVLSAQYMNRHQNELSYVMSNIDGSGEAEGKVFYTDKSDTYVEVDDNLIFLEDGESFLRTSEKSGYRHI